MYIEFIQIAPMLLLMFIVYIHFDSSIQQCHILGYHLHYIQQKLQYSLPPNLHQENVQTYLSISPQQNSHVLLEFFNNFVEDTEIKI